VSQHKRLQLLVSATAGLGKMGAWRGYVFEGHCHNTLSRPGTLQGRILTREGDEWKLQNVSQIDWKTSGETEEVELFQTADDLIGLKPGTYARPNPENFPGIDAIVADCGDGYGVKLIQCTVASKHGIQAKSVKDILSALQCDNATLFVAVPADRFDEYVHEQAWTTRKDEPQVVSIPGVAQQLVIKIDFCVPDVK